MLKKYPRLHMIGNAHLDPVWLWPWTEGYHEVKATFYSALERMKEYDDFMFVASSAAYYEWIEQNDPGMFEEIQQRVKEGRWVLVGGWWIQPDCNIPCGESFVRQALYAQRFFQAKFGVKATVGYNVDSFGHHGMLPQILKKSGLLNYVFMRPGPSEKGLPSRLFWWESDDGSRVLTFRVPFSYATWSRELEETVRLCAGEFQPPMNVGMCFYGFGNHGGGPSRENIESIHRMQQVQDMPELVFSAPDMFFNEVRAMNLKLPVVHDDLQHHASGCYSAHSGVKIWNRQAENRLLAAEKWSVVANEVSGLTYPENFEHAWKNVLFNQFHDILAGTSIESAYEDVRNFYGEALAIANRNLNASIQSLAWKIRIEPEPDMLPVLVFNPHVWNSCTPVEVEINQPSANAILVDDKDRIIPHQLVRSESAAPWRTRLCFIAEIPSLGYRVFRLKPGGEARLCNSMRSSDCELENENIFFSIDPQTGYIQKIIDKRLGVNLLAGPAARPTVLDDPSDTWSHNVFRYDKEIGSFKLSSIKLIEAGPVKATIRIANTYHESFLIQDFSLYQESSFIEIGVTVDWREHNKLLKLRFPFCLAATHTTYEIPYGHIERFANGEENPALNWVDVTGVLSENIQPYGVSLLTDAKYSFDSRSQEILNVHDIGLTVLRSPAFAHHLPMELEPGHVYSYMDQGRQSFRYMLIPHLGRWEDAGIVQRAAELNQKPFVLLSTFHPTGNLPQAYSFLDVDNQQVIVSVLKQCEDNDDLIIRSYETAGRTAHALVKLPLWERSLELEFTPCEIKTLRIPRNPKAAVKEVNLVEWDD
jgi:alpha-mannosidase